MKYRIYVGEPLFNSLSANYIKKVIADRKTPTSLQVRYRYISDQECYASITRKNKNDTIFFKSVLYI